LAVYREAQERDALHLRATLAVSPTWTGAGEAASALPELAAWAGGRGLGAGRLRVAGVCLHHGGDPEVARILHGAQPYTGWAGFVESANSPRTTRGRRRWRRGSGGPRTPRSPAAWPRASAPGEPAARRHPIRDRRWVLVHLNAADAGQLARIRRLGAVATTNPISYLWRSAADEAAKLPGGTETLLPHRSLLRQRIPFGLATDNKPADPWLAFAAVVARRDMTSGEVLGPAEQLRRIDARPALT